MKVWLPYISAGTGTDVFTRRLASVLKDRGCDVVLSPYAKKWQYFPWRLKAAPSPAGCDIIVTNSWNGFGFARQGAKHVTIEHLCVHDPALAQYKSFAQKLFHRVFVRRFERLSLGAADAAVAVSAYTAAQVARAFAVPQPQVIHNAVDTDFFCPSDAAVAQPGPVRILYVGNLSARKGADLLPAIMRGLGDGFVLYYTAGLRDEELIGHTPNMIPTGSLSAEQIRDECRKADILLFPTRLEGFGYVGIEAMACGTPVVASDCSSLPELIDDGKTGRLCAVDDVDAFVGAIRDLAEDRDARVEMGQRARDSVVERFSLEKWGSAYLALFRRLLDD